MWHGVRRGVLIGGVVIGAMAALAVPAGASITPTLTLDQSAGDTAGSTANLGLDLKFAPTGTDSPDDMILNLPPGLLANASIDGGACLKTVDLSDTACQVGSGTVTADGAIPTSVTFDLVPPPNPGDLAGLAVNMSGTQIGSTADVKVRPSGDPDGVGVTIDFVLPDMLDGVPISIAEISSTFNGLRYPATCPSTPHSFSVSVNSYSDATFQTVTAPLMVTGCSALPYSPAFTVTAARDSGDRQVKLSTQITEAADQAPSAAVTLAFPYAMLAPNFQSLPVICTDPASGTCEQVGSVSATSPLYPATLTGKAYLTGSVSAPTLTLVFPSPFPLTLTGTVDLIKNTTSFTGLPDIPLTDLSVSLAGGTNGLFDATCAPASGTATATLTDQNGDRTVNAPSNFTVSGCPSTAAGGPALTFRVRAARRAAKLKALTIELPAGLSFVRGGLQATGVRLSGARIKSLTLSHGHLLIALRRPVSGLTVRITAAALHESPALMARTKAGKLVRLLLTVVAENIHGKRATIRVHVTL